MRFVNLAENKPFTLSKSNLDKIVAFTVSETPKDIRDYIDPKNPDQIILGNFISAYEVMLSVEGFEEWRHPVTKDNVKNGIECQLRPPPIDLVIVNPLPNGMPELTVVLPAGEKRKIEIGNNVKIRGVLSFKKDNVFTYEAPGFRAKDIVDGHKYGHKEFSGGITVVTNVLGAGFLEKEEATLMFKVNKSKLELSSRGETAQDNVLREATLRAHNATRLVQNGGAGGIMDLTKGIKIYSGPDREFRATIEHPEFTMEGLLNVTNILDNEVRTVTLALVPKIGKVALKLDAAWHKDYSEFSVTIGGKSVPRNPDNLPNIYTFEGLGYRFYDIQIEGENGHGVVAYTDKIEILPNDNKEISIELKLEKQLHWDGLTDHDLVSLEEMIGGKKSVIEFKEARDLGAANPPDALDRLEKWNAKNKILIGYNDFLGLYKAAGKEYVDKEIYERYLMDWKDRVVQFDNLKPGAEADPDQARRGLMEWEAALLRDFKESKKHALGKFKENNGLLDDRVIECKGDLDLLEVDRQVKINLQNQWVNVEGIRDNIIKESVGNPLEAITKLEKWRDKSLSGFEIELMETEFKRDRAVIEEHYRAQAGDINKQIKDLKAKLGKAEPAALHGPRRAWVAFIREMAEMSYQKEFNKIDLRIKEGVAAETERRLKQFGGQGWIAADIKLKGIGEQFVEAKKKFEAIKKAKQAIGPKIRKDLIAMNPSARICAKTLSDLEQNDFNAVLKVLKMNKHQIIFLGKQFGGAAPVLKLPVIEKDDWQLVEFKDGKITGNHTIANNFDKILIHLWPDEQLKFRLARLPGSDLRDKKGSKWEYGTIEINGTKIQPGQPVQIVVGFAGDGARPVVMKEGNKWRRPEFMNQELSLFSDATAELNREIPGGKFIQIKNLGESYGVNLEDILTGVVNGKPNQNQYEVIRCNFELWGNTCIVNPLGAGAPDKHFKLLLKPAWEFDGVKFRAKN